jgi:hypothetical protein
MRNLCALVVNRLTWLILCTTLCPMLRAQTSLATETVKKMVVFLYAAPNAEEKNSLGTAFIIDVRLKSNPQLGTLFLITARHIVDPAWAYCSRPQPAVIYMRLNKTAYDPSKDKTGVEYLPIKLIDAGKPTYFLSDDDRVDAAVIALSWQDYPEDKYDYRPVSISLFASSDEIKKLSIGDSVASAGLLPGKSGENRNYPFFKFGQISNIPDEPTFVGCERGMPELRLERVWFIDANLVGGNSGSPIFYVPFPMCLPGSGTHCIKGLDRVSLIGVQSSSFGNTFVAGMTPIEYVFKIIEQHVSPDVDLYRGDEGARTLK